MTRSRASCPAFCDPLAYPGGRPRDIIVKAREFRSVNCQITHASGQQPSPVPSPQSCPRTRLLYTFSRVGNFDSKTMRLGYRRLSVKLASKKD